MSIRTVKVSNVSLGATELDIREFFYFSGDIDYVEMRSHSERSQIAFVTFKDSQGAETAVLLSDLKMKRKICIGHETGGLYYLISSLLLQPLNHRYLPSSGIVILGATIVDLSVNVTLDPHYQLPPAPSSAPLKSESKTAGGAESAFRKTEDVVSSMLAKGFVFGKDAVNKAKSFDEKHQLTSTATAKVASFDKKIGLSEKITIGTSAVNDKVRGVDQKFQVSEKAKSAFAAAEQKVSSAGSTIMKNQYVFTGASWMTGTFSKITKAAGEVRQKTKEKVGMAEEEQRRKMVDVYAQIHLS